MKLRPLVRAVLLVIPSGLALGAASLAHAQQTPAPAKPAAEKPAEQQPAKPGAQAPERIVVTATKRETALQASRSRSTLKPRTTSAGPAP